MTEIKHLCAIPIGRYMFQWDYETYCEFETKQSHCLHEEIAILDSALGKSKQQKEGVLYRI